MTIFLSDFSKLDNTTHKTLQNTQLSLNFTKAMFLTAAIFKIYKEQTNLSYLPLPSLTIY